jgi:hypothetical protein
MESLLWMLFIGSAVVWALTWDHRRRLRKANRFPSERWPQD